MSVPPGPGQPYPPAQPYPPPAPGQPYPPPVPGTGYPQPGPAQPPPGPGAVVPFAAPPTEKDRKRLWISLAVAGALALVCLAGGIVGVVALVSSSRVRASDATARVVHYLDALQAHDYAKAYDDLCADQRDKQSERQFAQAQGDQIGISSYELGTPVQRTDGFNVPASIELVSGDQVDATFGVILDGPGELRICSISG